MKRNEILTAFTVAALMLSGCNKEERGPILSGGREVKSWLAELHDPKATVRRTAVLKLGNIGDSDPAVADALAEALHDKEAIVRRDAVKALAKMTTLSNEIKAQLRMMSETDRDPTARDYATKVLAHFGAGK